MLGDTMSEHTMHHTSLKRLEEAVNKLTQHQAILSQNHQTLSQANSELNHKLNWVLDHLASLTSALPSPKPPPSPPPISPSIPHMKLNVPLFDGQDPLGWIFKITQFFDYQDIPNAERLTIALFYMEGPALF